MKDTLNDIDFQKRHINLSSHFKRQRVLGFAHIAGMLINRIVKGVRIEISNFLNTINTAHTCTKQAFSKARQKLSHTAFIELNALYVSSFYQSKLYKSYEDTFRLIAVYGSLCQLPSSDHIVAHFGAWKNNTQQGMPMGRASVVYDVYNKVAINTRLASLDISETDLFREQYEELSMEGSSDRPIYLMDRGYSSHDLCKMMEENGDYFVIRCKKDFCKAVSDFVDTGEQEATIVLQPTVWYTKKGEKKASRFNAPLTVRIVHIQLDKGNDEYLITNLEQVSINQLKYLYNLRWGIETYYDYLKDSMELENFSSKTVEGILQDFHACILASNLVNLLIQEAEQELKVQQRKKQNKYNYQINRKTATGILRDQVINILFNETDIAGKLERLKKQIKTSKTAVVPGRKFPRLKQKRSRRKYHMPKKKAL